MMDKVLYRIVGLWMLWMAWMPMKAQMVREIRISQDRFYSDHISLKNDSKDMDVIVKFMFDEPNNALTVSLMSYRNLFVFQDNVRYGQVVKRKKLRPERFPYVVEADVEMKYRLTKELRSLIESPKKKHVFKKWLEYEGLQPQPTEFKMVNDYIEQKFDILDKDTLVKVSLRDIMVMELSQNKKKSYDFIHYTHLDRTYEIHIDRNPCLGREEEIEMAAAMEENIRLSYITLKERFDSQEALSKESISLLEEMRGMLLEQFPARHETSPCASVRLHLDAYNCYVDSIKGLGDLVFAFEQQKRNLAIGSEQILSVARIVDNNVASWLISTDVVEKDDLVKQCQTLIHEITQYLMEDVVMDAEQAVAVDVFRKAENYFKTTCLPIKKEKRK